MTVRYQCDKCKSHFAPDQVVALKYSKLGVGEFHRIHLCDAKCHKELEEWLGSKNV